MGTTGTTRSLLDLTLEVRSVVLSEHHRCLVNIPRTVWHADHNIGSKDVVVGNVPTSAYDHSNPDKYRLPMSVADF